jgi:hypothetical protein
VTALAFAPEVLELYIREDLNELDNPLRQDERIILQDLRFLFRAYGQKYKRIEDWSPASRGREDAPDGALNINGGN